MALAGLKRLGLDDAVTEVLEPDRIVPAVGQGVLRIEIREADDRVRSLLAPIHDEDSWRCVTAERAFLNELEGGCQVPDGALGVFEGRDFVFRGFVGDVDGGCAKGEFSGLAPINDDDLSLLLAHWTGPLGGAVPEPAVAAILIAAAPMLRIVHEPWFPDHH